jgi:hypothetical protein
VNSRLGRAVYGHGCEWRVGQSRSDIHDGGFLLPPELWDQLRAQVDRSDQIRSDLLIGLAKISRPLKKVDVSLNTGVIDQDIELLELR